MNLTQTSDNEPALLIAECGENGKEMVMLNEENVVPSGREVQGERSEKNVWYLDNGASNHMTGDRSKFNHLDEKIAGKVRFGDGSTVNIEGRGSIVFKCKNGE